ncbi:uncharacterized protein LOC125219944 [Salvia hispanica]|uniref:uncharacterized protein LOC125219944 n=1 Tax=Salvia hispanica TaxID=49212 RepID=UPI0020096D3D|nr:uncharacterized protein LOC125219944 [Salvia hispanica]
MEEGPRTTLFLSSSRKNLVVQFLLKHSIDGVLTRGAVMEAAEEHGISRKTVYRLWKKAKQQMQMGEPAIMEGKVKGYHHSNKLILDEEKACLTQIMVFRGGNNYKVPHINKNRLERTVGLPNALDVDEELVRDVLEYLWI